MSAAAEGAGEPRIGYLGLGSNIGDRQANLAAAVDALRRRRLEVLRASAVYETEPVGLVLDQPPFLNACLTILTSLGPIELLDTCKDVEREVGRAAGGERHGPRAIDVDVLVLGNLAYRSERMILPHPEVANRRFVMVPLVELAPDLVLPDGRSLLDAVEALDGAPGQDVRRFGPPLV